MRIQLGTVVRDRVTGFVGVADNRATFLYGCDRYCVQPRIDKEGKVPDSQMIDYPQLEIVEGEKVAMFPAPEPEQLVELGQLVLDPVKDMEGTVMGRAVYLNGCARILIAPKQKGDKQRESWWVDEPQVKPRNSFIKKVTKVEKKRGGPALSNSKY
ncbi:MAG: hypothetical protein KAJ19_15835 [Gammaproteobacteria bacterium]|nr:hypothetical protein [Gammaproteobacteria bacterium]